MKRLSICWIIGCLLGLVACRPEVPAQAEQGETDVFPDYRKLLYRSIWPLPISSWLINSYRG